MAEKQCTICGEVKYISEFQKDSRKKDGLKPNCKACCSVQKSTYREKNREKLRIKDREYNKNPERKERARIAAAERRANGLRESRLAEYIHQKQKRGTHVCWLSDREKRVLDDETKRVISARKEWNRWLKEKAPTWWLDKYYMATGKPWLDHRLSEAEKFTKQYELDKRFREKERERTRMYKFSHPETVAGWNDAPGNRRRWNQAAISADGTVTKKVVSRLMRTKRCAYCLEPINKDNRHIDHVTPLSKGGIHGVDNLVSCCQHCNASKGSKKLWQWLPKLSNSLMQNEKSYL